MQIIICNFRSTFRSTMMYSSLVWQTQCNALWPLLPMLNCNAAFTLVELNTTVYNCPMTCSNTHIIQFYCTIYGASVGANELAVIMTHIVQFYSFGTKRCRPGNKLRDKIMTDIGACATYTFCALSGIRTKPGNSQKICRNKSTHTRHNLFVFQRLTHHRAIGPLPMVCNGRPS